MIDHGGIALDSPIDGQIGAVASIGDFLVFENPKRGLSGLGRTRTSPEELHAHLGRSTCLGSVDDGEEKGGVWRAVRDASLEVDLLVLEAVETSTSVNEDGWEVFGLVVSPQHTVEGTIGAERTLCHHRGSFDMMTIAHALLHPADEIRGP